MKTTIEKHQSSFGRQEYKGDLEKIEQLTQRLRQMMQLELPYMDHAESRVNRNPLVSPRKAQIAEGTANSVSQQEQDASPVVTSYPPKPLPPLTDEPSIVINEPLYANSAALPSLVKTLRPAAPNSTNRYQRDRLTEGSVDSIAKQRSHHQVETANRAVESARLSFPPNSQPAPELLGDYAAQAADPLLASEIPDSSAEERAKIAEEIGFFMKQQMADERRAEAENDNYLQLLKATRIANEKNRIARSTSLQFKLQQAWQDLLMAISHDHKNYFRLKDASKNLAKDWMQKFREVAVDMEIYGLSANVRQKNGAIKSINDQLPFECQYNWDEIAVEHGVNFSIENLRQNLEKLQQIMLQNEDNLHSDQVKIAISRLFPMGALENVDLLNLIKNLENYNPKEAWKYFQEIFASEIEVQRKIIRQDYQTCDLSHLEKLFIAEIETAQKQFSTPEYQAKVEAAARKNLLTAWDYHYTQNWQPINNRVKAQLAQTVQDWQNSAQTLLNSWQAKAKNISDRVKSTEKKLPKIHSKTLSYAAAATVSILSALTLVGRNQQAVTDMEPKALPTASNADNPTKTNSTVAKRIDGLENSKVEEAKPAIIKPPKNAALEKIEPVKPEAQPVLPKPTLPAIAAKTTKPLSSNPRQARAHKAIPALEIGKRLAMRKANKPLAAEKVTTENTIEANLDRDLKPNERKDAVDLALSNIYTIKKHLGIRDDLDAKDRAQHSLLPTEERKEMEVRLHLLRITAEGMKTLSDYKRYQEAAKETNARYRELYAKVQLTRYKLDQTEVAKHANQVSKKADLALKLARKFSQDTATVVNIKYTDAKNVVRQRGYDTKLLATAVHKMLQTAKLERENAQSYSSNPDNARKEIHKTKAALRDLENHLDYVLWHLNEGMKYRQHRKNITFVPSKPPRSEQKVMHNQVSNKA